MVHGNFVVKLLRRLMRLEAQEPWLFWGKARQSVWSRMENIDGENVRNCYNPYASFHTTVTYLRTIVQHNCDRCIPEAVGRGDTLSVWVPRGGYQPRGCIDSVSCRGLEQVSEVVTDSRGFSCLTEILGSVTVVLEDCPRICHSCVGRCMWIVTVSHSFLFPLHTASSAKYFKY